MAIFTVHSKAGTDAGDAIFVRDSFQVWAFIFGPLWLLAKGFWLILLVYLALFAGLAFALHHFMLPPGPLMALALLAHGLIGLEAAKLRADRLERRGFETVAVVQGSRRDDAERRYFGAIRPSGPANDRSAGRAEGL